MVRRRVVGVARGRRVRTAAARPAVRRERARRAYLHTHTRALTVCLSLFLVGFHTTKLANNNGK